MSAKQKIFIGVPCYGGVPPEVLEDWMRFAFYCGRQMRQYEFKLGIKTKSEQFRARNAIVEAAIQQDCDWLLMMDDDMIINPHVTTGPTEDYAFIERLISHDKDICGVLYYQRTGDCCPVLMSSVGTGFRFLRDDEVTGGLQKVDVAGGGCLLIKVGIFDKIPYPYFEPEFRYGTDIQLCNRAREKGFEVWADTSIQFGHVRQERVVITGENRHQEITNTLPGELKKTFVGSRIYERLVEDACEYTGLSGIDEMVRLGNSFLELRKLTSLSDAEWYREHATERVARQVAFNTQNPNKVQMTQYILSSIDHHKQVDILDFGCGIGITAFALAEKGHRVTAMDIRGTGTFEFLKWRAKKHDVDIRFVDSEGGKPELDSMYDIIIAMDSIEHIEDWRGTVRELGEHLVPTGALFSNNGILEDHLHPEHYSIDNKEFIERCMGVQMMPFNQITYIKKAKEAVSA